MGVKFAVGRLTSRTTAGDDDCDIAGFGTVKAAIFIATKATTAGGAMDADTGLSIGFTDLTNQVVQTCQAADAAASTQCDRANATDEVIMILDDTGAVEGEANYKEPMTDGVRITWGVASATAYQITYVLIGGSDVSADVGTFNQPDTEGTTLDTACGFEPDQVFFTGAAQSFPGSTTRYHAGLGFASNNASIEQASLCSGAADGSSAETLRGVIIQNNRCIYALNGTPALSRGCELTTFHPGPTPAAGFETTTRVSDDFSAEWGYLALDYGSWTGSHKVLHFDSPTTTGSKGFTGVGFKPQFVMKIMSMAQAANTLYTNADADFMAVSCMDASTQICDESVDEDAAPTSVAKSRSKAVATSLHRADNTAIFNSTFTSFDSDGWTENFPTDADGTARKWAVLAVEEDVQVPAAETLFTVTSPLRW